jgi:hypothetical protein
MVRLRVGFVSLVAFVFSIHAFAEPGFVSVPELPAELASQAAVPPGFSPFAKRHIQTPEPMLQATGKGEVKLVLSGAKVLRLETTPEVPYFEYPITASGTVLVRATARAMAKSMGPVPLARVGETLFWSSDPSFRFKEPGGSDRFFPGKLAEVVTQGEKAWVRVFPLQWDRSSGEVLRIGDIEFELYSKPNDSVNSSSVPPVPMLSVIVVREAKADLAKALQDYHRSEYAVLSEIVTVEAIEQNEKELPESDLPDGYKDRLLGDDAVEPYDPATKQGYDYSLARKIAAYFQRRLSSTNSQLKYITLVGDALAIPPSYYFSIRSSFGAKFGVTDQCYAAVHQCLEPRASVGRLPFHSLGQVRNYLSKVTRWRKQAPQAKSDLALYGGKPFQGPFYIGELGSLRALEGKADWRGVQKYFRTKNNYSRSAILSLVSGAKESSFAMSMDHGTGNRWHVENEVVSSNEILRASSAGDAINPVVLSIACSNAAFDETLSRDEIFAEPNAGNVSVGVAMLQSKAGAVAYFGSSRPAMGSPIFEVDSRGNLESIDSNHGLKLFETALEQYRTAGGGRIGDGVRLALTKYALDPGSSLAKDRFRWTYFNAAFLGDPVMVLPKRATTERAFEMAVAMDEIEEGFSHLFPSLFLPSSGSASLRFGAATAVEATLFRQENFGSRLLETVVESGSFPGGVSDFAFSEETVGSSYFLRLENTVGVPVERQVWFRTE